MKMPWQIMTPGDWLVVLLMLTSALAGIAIVTSAPAGSRVVVTVDGQTRFTAPLDAFQEVDVEGPLGKTHLVIDAQGARIVSSPCPRKICIAMGPARDTSDLVACVPNHILVRITGNDNPEKPYDLLSR